MPLVLEHPGVWFDYFRRPPRCFLPPASSPCFLTAHLVVLLGSLLVFFFCVFTSLCFRVLVFLSFLCFCACFRVFFFHLDSTLLRFSALFPLPRHER